ncbi:MAG: 30S ribosomal protein S16 [Desulfomonile tiedjei]|nr:30S ribosomal protein S16 [Desulfomonile tiedjei]
MAVRIRLARHGSKKKPFYRVVAAANPFTRDGRFLEVLGTYDPRNKTSGINLNVEAVQKWVASGAQLSPTVRRILKQCARTASTPS